MRNPKLEVACFDLASALIAADNEADRIEFAANYAEGGVTPNIDSFISLKKVTNTPIYILIRSRAGNFQYSNRELDDMIASVREFKNAGADGFVFGCLNTSNEVDIPYNSKLIDAAGELPCTFHRAMDRTADLRKALEDIIALGFSTILSSGGRSNALEGSNALEELIKISNGRIDIMPGGGIRSSNIEELKIQCPAEWYHSACILPGKNETNAEELKNIKLKLRQ
jgi:copper homeostasis protein